VSGHRRASWTLDDLLSRPRLRRYLDSTDGDRHAALELYSWNSQVSAAFYESLHYLEIGLRNAMDLQLCQFVNDRGGTSRWYVDPVVPLTPHTRQRIAKARAHAVRGGGPEVHGKVIAELMLGFWWSLLADEYNRRLWQPCLRGAFEGPVRRTHLHNALDGMRLFRNRIAHHEPIYQRDLAAMYRTLLDTAFRISPVLRDRIGDTSRVPRVLASRPT
jgi:hypothetical protein